ncbi:zinc-dependent alcohol dehydrogenase family protein [Lichenifustis flavocetrariae]|uniref:NAD(P)-dependent alcohol dehydrogenase n=1 Tax=Lichenifustis flavocetrariae TaxID=2949735 RepID=A0AA41YWT6_9HYPH|nr:NAD(P)-dependent alcohol dehydrogenase [Lichenifustis flavocetrariae]MCW6510034.1 NAD(P)-dependent alcohol dehydrogenase [Lichenifustis flavocetrariae]
MKLWALNDYGRANLRQRSAPIPEPGPGEVLVKVAAVSLNHRDIMMVADGMGAPLSFPFSPGSDMAGSVAALGEGAARFSVGDRVISTFMPGWIDGRTAGNARTPSYRALGGELPGVLAEYLVVPDGWLVRAPQSLDDGEASTLPVAGLTAWFALIERGTLRAGETVLVQGTGGVALFGIQIARMHGATVIVTSGSSEKLDRAKALGATYVINRHTEDWVEAVYHHTRDHGADHILELIGGANLGRSIAAVAVAGRISVIGLLEGLELSGPAVPLLLKSPVIQGVAVGHRRALEDFVLAIDRNGLKPVIQRRYGFDALPEALAAFDCGPFGKIVVEIA